jgi:AmmeMemoRadiSam system protein A
MGADSGNSGLTLSVEQGGSLLKLARRTIAGKLAISWPAAEGPGPEELSPKIFQERRGVFVTLKIAGQLRGCIGSLAASATIMEGVRRNALNAAFDDPRFPPLGLEEFDRLLIEVSILTTPRALSHAGGDDLLERLRPHTDGVIIRRGYQAATFLPQVWDQLPESESFLTHLCLKAGLPQDAWHHRELEVQTYQVQHFEEQARAGGR